MGKSILPGSAINSSAPSTTPPPPRAAGSRSRSWTASTLARFQKVARLGRTLRAWKAQILAYFDTHGVSNGGTEAINLIIEKVRRLAHGFKEFDHYRLRIMLAETAVDPTEHAPTMLNSEDPL
jgi:hypothetical protein